MIEILTIKNNNLIQATDEKENIWISLTAPTKIEIKTIVEKYQIDKDLIEASLDKEEVSRIEFEEDNQILILINASIEERNKQKILDYTTIPVGIIKKNKIIVTVSLEKLEPIEKLKDKKQLDITNHSRLILEIFYEIAIKYLNDLRKIDKYTYEIEGRLLVNQKNEYLIKLLALEKNLVYFSTALTTNEWVLNKIKRSKILNFYDKDQELLADTEIELKQAQEMATINSKVIRSIRDAFASIISNNLNTVMKILASFTIILTIPTMIYSFFGMNSNLGILASTKSGTIIILLTSLIISLVVYKIMKKKNMF